MHITEYFSKILSFASVNFYNALVNKNG